ncbi:endopeptidase La [Brumimicrobium aurantiacum]|uniref:Lon protease n=1 Tax=Brumimicrobium aurantiacum TaxID=1737063 RepID=A0A3E1EVG1_9FLAO|nr:endopeptidase La [Brumimicrobium aurantiacum]RFC53473.1 endopeptidase La [Brumimicrobium aurantiacum]
MNDIFDKGILGVGSPDDSDAEFIPLITQEEEDDMQNAKFPEDIPILPLRNNVLFPGVVIPITVGRDKSIDLIKHANNSDKVVGVVSQKNAEVENPLKDDLHEIGTVATILRLLKMPDGSSTVIIQGKRRFKLEEISQEKPFLRGKIELLEESKTPKENKEFTAIIQSMKELSLKIIKESPNIPSEAQFAIKNIDSPSFLTNFISANMNADVATKQKMLEEMNLKKRAMSVLEHLTLEAQQLEMRNEIQTRVKVDLDKQQREYFLNQQIKTIQEELGGNPQEQDVEKMRERAKKKQWTTKVDEIFHKELNRLQRMNPQGAEYTVQLNYLDLLLDLPWDDYTKDNLDLNRAKKILERDHYGLEKVKKRILEYLAVLKLKKDMKSPILCFYGPPGVGKTSLGKSIAEALGRKYVRMSLGGIHDESEIRGHRKTYIGAMPGRVMQNLKKAGKSNPVFVLDEIDKISRSNHGDPSSAMLEVLDPEQNDEFYDNYIETEYDLSKVLFIATANDLSTIQGPLRDRMELIEVSGYTVEEKIEIAKRHLVPNQIAEHGIKKSDISIGKATLEKLIEEYTHESGVRGLDKAVAKLVRNRARQIAMEEEFKKSIAAKDLVDIMGPGRPKTKYANNNVAGVVTGLAWTSMGGDILFIESSMAKGKGKLTLTGNLGDVMKESATIALQFLKAHHDWLDLDANVFNKYDVHMHVPEGATPKDGPSAGITMLTSLASLFTQRKVKKNIAMTGEITLRGDVLPVGGIKEKILAAKRADIKELILCEKNKQDIDEINEEYLKGLSFHFVSNMREVLDIALSNQKVKDALTVQ